MTTLKTGTAKLALAIARKSQGDIAQAFALNACEGFDGVPTPVIAMGNGGVTLELPTADGPVPVGFLQLLEPDVWQAFAYRLNVIPEPVTFRSKEALHVGSADSVLGAVYLIIGNLRSRADPSA